jgi:zinc transport system substrate-binding protein
MADTINRETGVKKLLLHSVHNVSKRDYDAGLGYLDFMRRNVEHLREALY